MVNNMLHCYVCAVRVLNLRINPTDDGRWYKRIRPQGMGSNHFIKTLCGQSNPPDEVLMKVGHYFANSAFLRTWSIVVL